LLIIPNKVSINPFENFQRLAGTLVGKLNPFNLNGGKGVPFRGLGFSKALGKRFLKTFFNFPIQQGRPTYQKFFPNNLIVLLATWY